MAFVTLKEPTDYLEDELCVVRALTIEAVKGTEETFEVLTLKTKANAETGNPAATETMKRLRELARDGEKISNEIKRRKQQEPNPE